MFFDLPHFHHIFFPRHFAQEGGVAHFPFARKHFRPRAENRSLYRDPDHWPKVGCPSPPARPSRTRFPPRYAQPSPAAATRNRLHREYDDMVSRALAVPADTEAFLALGDYMLLVKTTFVNRIMDAAKQLSAAACHAARYAALPADLWAAHAATVRRVRDITSVLSEYSAAYEIGKLVAEERLATAIGQLHQDADAFAPSLTFLDRIDDIDKLAEYRPVCGARGVAHRRQRSC